MGKYASLQERLELNSKRIKRGCVVWTGYCQKEGYVVPPGTMGAYGKINLTRDGRSLKFYVHRVSKILDELLQLKAEFDFYDKVDKRIFFELLDAYYVCGLTIDHNCENTLCRNPDHLEWVTLTVNQQRKKWTVRQNQIKVRRGPPVIHPKALDLSPGVVSWIRRIRSKSYRNEK